MYRGFSALWERKFLPPPVIPVALVATASMRSGSNRVTLSPSQGSLRAAADGVLVEARDGVSNRLLGFGFVNARFSAVDIVERTTPQSRQLPRVDEQYFQVRLLELFDKQQLPPLTTCGRTIDGAQGDLVTGLYVDRFATSYARIIATNRGAESLVPLCIETLATLGTEELVVFTPSLGFVRDTIAPKGFCRNPTFMELGLSYPWPDRATISDDDLAQQYVTFGYRGASLALLRLVENKSVLVANCPVETAVFAVANAKRAVVAHAEAPVLDRTRDALTLNFGHSSSVAEFVPLQELPHRPVGTTWDVIVVHDVVGPASLLVQQPHCVGGLASRHGVMGQLQSMLAWVVPTSPIAVVFIVTHATCGVTEWSLMPSGKNQDTAAEAARLAEQYLQCLVLQGTEAGPVAAWRIESVERSTACFTIVLKSG